MIATKTYENEKLYENEKFIIDTIVSAIAEAFHKPPDEISIVKDDSDRLKKEGKLFILLKTKKGNDIGSIFMDTEDRKISINLHVGEEGEAKEVANNLKKDKKIQALVKEGYAIGIDYPWLPEPWMEHRPWD